jgi:hypothetical protein
MSLQQLTTSTVGTEGIKKQIDERSTDIIFDMLQVYAYSNPIQSTVRELASNAVDAQREKEIAQAILSGTKKAEDFFIEKIGKEFEDSKFKAEYFDLKWLNKEQNTVELEYISNEGSGFCDEFVVRDYGVGIGGERLEGVLKLGYSTKRNTRELIGGYGVGQKAALSTGAPFYTLVTAHNGRLFKLNIYSKKADSLIGVLNEETGKPNEFITFSKGEKVYFENTKSLNFTEIRVPVKKLNQHKYLDAVDSQLLYLPNIRCYITDGKYRNEHKFKADILYESKNLIISKNSQFSRPHIIIVKDKNSNTGICYNEINYKELELEQRYGAVALKVQVRSTRRLEDGTEELINEGVTVTPNREQVIWNDETKAYLLSITQNVSTEASEIINKELKEKDFVKWIQKAIGALDRLNYHGVISELARMIDKSSIHPKYEVDPSIQFTDPKTLFWGMNVRWTHYEDKYSRKKSKTVTTVNRDDVDSWSKFVYSGGSDRPVYIQTENTDYVKDRYVIEGLLKQTGWSARNGGFITIKLDDITERVKEIKEKMLPSDKSAAAKASVDDYVNKLIAKRDLVFKYIQASKVVVNYEDIDVPADFKVKHSGTEPETDEDGDEMAPEKLVSPEELRKMNGEVVFFTFDIERRSYRPELKLSKIEVKLSEVGKISKRIFYGFDEDVPKLKAACSILGGVTASWYNKDIAIIRISRQLHKVFKNYGEPINRFFSMINDDNVMSVSPELSKYYTAYYISGRLGKQHRFLEKFGPINKEISDLYVQLRNFEDLHYARVRSLRGAEHESGLVELLGKQCEFQIFVIQNSDNASAIADKSQELFGVPSVTNIELIDPIVYKQLAVLDEYVEEIHQLMSTITFLTSSYDAPTAEQIKLIRIILKAKNLDDFVIPEELLKKA